MICPYCGHFRKANATMVGRVRRGRDISALCTKCSKRFMVNAETILEGEDETEVVMCRICKTRQAEPGMLLCNDCWSYQNERRQTRQRQEKVEKERKERRCLKPKKSIDELNAEAAAHNMSYGKYVAMLYMKELRGSHERIQNRKSEEQEGMQVSG